ncbi:MAG: SDR family NAD(P)-dependent oxidoreductase [Pseudomonadota bacterium]
MSDIFKQTFDLSSKRVFLTGASAGLGKHFAKVLCAAGADVVMAARSVDKLEALAKDLEPQAGSCSSVALDVRDRSAIAEVIAAVEAQRPIDVLVNNAGIAIVRKPEKLSDDDWDAVYETNLRAPWTLAREVIKHRLVDGRECSIINIASVLGLSPIGHLAPYAAAKAGLINMGRDLCVDLAHQGIRVNAIAPGYFETEMNRDWLNSEGGQEMMRGIPTGRFGALKDLDGTLLLLASEASRFINGTVVTVDGGHSAGIYHRKD